tara:strand:+ start:327 stop:755 length:429 start_codon:yes stop_codon:yes gene_type:complete
MTSSFQNTQINYRRKAFFSNYVLAELKYQDPIWYNPSENIIKLTTDYGSVQKNHTDLERILYDYKPHTYFFNWLLESELNDNINENSLKYLDCEDCIWGKFGCSYKTKEQQLVNKLIFYWNLDFIKEFYPEDYIKIVTIDNV